MSSHLIEIFDDEKLVAKIKNTLALLVSTCRVREFESRQNGNGSWFCS